MKKHIALLILSTLLAMAPVLQIVAQSSVSMIGKTDIPALIEEAPAAPITLEEAARRAYGPNLAPARPPCPAKLLPTFPR